MTREVALRAAGGVSHAMTGPAVLLDGIGELVTNVPSGDAGDRNDPGDGADVRALGIRRDCALVISGGRVVWIGSSADAPPADERVDCDGAAVIPGFVDSHAHLVFAGDRSAEFAARMAGQRYEAGGIRATVAATRAASDDLLRGMLRRLVGELLASGTTTFEVKSGYGLTVADEERSCRLAAEVTSDVDIPRCARRAPGVQRGPRGLPRPADRADAGGMRTPLALDRRVLRSRGLRRDRGARRPAGRRSGRPRASGPCQPAPARPRGDRRRRARRGLSRPLHAPQR